MRRVVVELTILLAILVSISICKQTIMLDEDQYVVASTLLQASVSQDSGSDIKLNSREWLFSSIFFASACAPNKYEYLLQAANAQIYTETTTDPELRDYTKECADKFFRVWKQRSSREETEEGICQLGSASVKRKVEEFEKILAEYPNHRFKKAITKAIGQLQALNTENEE